MTTSPGLPYIIADLAKSLYSSCKQILTHCECSRACERSCVRVRAFMCACVRACVRVCVRACVQATAGLSCYSFMFTGDCKTIQLHYCSINIQFGWPRIVAVYGGP